jgi:hypothetical protein
LDAAQLLWIVVFSSIRLGFFLYGRKQWKIVPMSCAWCL